MSDPVPSGPGRRGQGAVIGNLQALRAAAAIVVVLFNLGPMPATRPPFTIGAAAARVRRESGILLLVGHRGAFRSVAGRGGLLVVGIGVVLLLTVPPLVGYDPHDHRGRARVMCWGLSAGAIVPGAVIASAADRRCGAGRFCC